jgi:lambda repressor-like predicted transcriptional regulator
MSNFPTPEKITETINSNVRAELRRQGHNLEWLAGDLGVSVDGLLGDMSEHMPPHLIWDIAEALNVPAPELLEAR